MARIVRLGVGIGTIYQEWYPSWYFLCKGLRLLINKGFYRLVYH